MSRPVVAAFDFDGTLSRGTSGIRLYRHLLGSAAFLRMGVWHLGAAIRFGMRWGDEAALGTFNRVVLGGREAAAVQREVERYCREVLPHFLIPASLARLQAHRDQGHRCVIVSRGYELYLRPWAAGLGVTDVLATRLIVGADGRFTGEMPEPSCDRAVKRERLFALLGPRENYELHAYGDSPGDYEMLAAADHAWMRGRDGFVRWSPR
jgi:phosphatidylglycerophosphatase C